MRSVRSADPATLDQLATADPAGVEGDRVAADAERGRDCGDGGLGRFAADRGRGDRDDERVTVPACIDTAYARPRGPGLTRNASVTMASKPTEPCGLSS
jgi:hypothetical protein